MPDPGIPPEQKRVRPADRPAKSNDQSVPPALPSSASEGAADAATRRGAELSYPGSELIGTGTPKEILSRILLGDPLGLVARARGWLDVTAYLIDANRLAVRTMAHIAYSARRYQGKPDLSGWIELLMERAVKELINEDLQAERLKLPVAPDALAPFSFVADALGIDPSLARRACVIFNGMAEYDRRVFYATSVQGKSIHRHVSEGHGPPARADAALRRVLARLQSIDGMPESQP